MQFTLLRLGAQQVDIDPQTVITFPQGIAPFESQHYKLFHEEGKSSVFWLQSLDEPDLMFSLTDPELLSINYEVTLTSEEQQVLDIHPEDELVLTVILFKSEEGSEPVRANMRGPVILNVSRRLGLQKILEGFEATVSVRGR